MRRPSTERTCPASYGSIMRWASAMRRIHLSALMLIPRSTHCDIKGLRFYPRDPLADSGKTTQVEAALVRAMRIGKERDVRDRVLAARKPLVRLEVAFHDTERGIAGRDFRFERRPALRGIAQVPDDVARGCDVGLVAVLLEKHPLQRLRSRKL